ncbi:STAS domain-containing protein [Lysobacter soli]|uniref:STAS domain-containing protein n=1 Tax=Lysobacter soli TaxID=453783 RepID=UPI00240F9BBC|nr:STAS domain-containing protein [Lysobacter soli]MDG2517950.1 STAS domain-containing protein [Lysobacter soli]
MNLHELFLTEKDAIRSGWIQELQRVSGNLAGRVSQADLMKRADEMSGLLVQALQSSGDNTVDTVDFTILDRFFDEFARDRVEQGFNSEETATFVFTLKRPLFERIQARTAGDAQAMAQLSWDATELIDRLGLRAVSAFQRMREAVIERQQHELLELSTPVVKLWKDVLALPIIGTLDSNRTQIMMETLLTRIAETEAAIAIIDITGVPTVDTLVAQHLIKTVTAIRLMGADCIISGVRPQIAQTIVHLGVDLGEVTTKANLADALALALKRTGVRVVSGGEAA